jgi:hypothetical protein
MKIKGFRKAVKEAAKEGVWLVNKLQDFIQSLLIEEREKERQRILESEIMKDEDLVPSIKTENWTDYSEKQGRNELRKSIISLIKGRE